MKKEMILALIAYSLVLLPMAVPALAQADETGPNASSASELDMVIGDRFVIRGKGLAVTVDDGARKRFRASLLLEIRITDVSGPEVKFTVERGSMTIDGKTMEIKGEGNYNAKGRHITVHLDGDEVKAVLQGHVKAVRRRIVIGLQGRGNVGDDNYGFRFLCLARKEEVAA